jgi:NAD(P)-dependent dehydrogenase (short-subunit alcohol dehydrogenase family)
MARHPGPVLVTGANSGIGLATALRLARRGWEVWGTARSRAKAEALADAARDAKSGGRVRPLVLDVSDHDAVVEVWPELPDFWGVVNNAGYTELGALEEVSARQARAQLDVNLIAPAVVSACALPGMRRLGGGRIVMVSSIAGLAAVMPLNGWYHASKFGLEALSDVLRVEVAPFGVRVAIVEPGFFRTGIGHDARGRAEQALERAESPYSSAYKRVTSMIELVQRLAPSPDVVARTIGSALESRSPRRRYLVGVDAMAMAAAQALTPRSVIDLVMRYASDLRSAPAQAKAKPRTRTAPAEPAAPRAAASRPKRSGTRPSRARRGEERRER